MNQHIVGDQDGTTATHEVHERKKSVAIPAIMAGALAALLLLPVLTRYRAGHGLQPPPGSDQVAAARYQQDDDTRGETQGNFGPQSEKQRASLVLSPQLLNACGLSQTAAYFATGSAALNQDDPRSLEGLVACLKRGGLSAAVVEIAGQSDAGASTARDSNLAQDRADAVARFLRDAGLAPERIRTTSAGDASEQLNNSMATASEPHVDIYLAR